MSITLFPSGNSEYCRDHGLVTRVSYDCQCKDFPVAQPCRECNGTGRVHFDHDAFELNLANGNFATFWSSLGFDPEYTGSLEGRVILDALRIYDPELAVKAGDEGVGEHGCRWISVGTDLDRVGHYVSMLTEIAEEAVRREVPVVWG